MKKFHCFRFIIIAICLIALFAGCTKKGASSFDFVPDICEEVSDTEELLDGFRGVFSVPDIEGYTYKTGYRFKDIMAILEYKDNDGQLIYVYSFLPEAWTLGNGQKDPAFEYRTYLGDGQSFDYEDDSLFTFHVIFTGIKGGPDGDISRFYICKWYGETQEFLIMSTKEMYIEDYTAVVSHIGIDEFPPGGVPVSP